MEGLDCAEINFSRILVDTDKLRIDSGYYSKKYLHAIHLLESLPYGSTTLGEISQTLRKGIFDIKAESYVETGIPFIRIGNLKNAIIAEANLVYISRAAHDDEMKTALKRGDFILSKTAYPAASWVSVDECNTSQDTIAGKLNWESAKRFDTRFLVVFLNSAVGLAVSERLFQGNVQLHLSLPDASTIPIPNLSFEFQKSVGSIFSRSLDSAGEAKRIYMSAEAKLLLALGLTDWKPPVCLTYEKSVTIALTSRRLDAEFFHPRIDDLYRRLGDRKQSVSDVVNLRTKRFSGSLTPINYLEIGAVSTDGVVVDSIIDGSDAPSRATWHVSARDVVTSTVRPIRGLSAMIEDHQDGAVASSGFAVLEPTEISSELLLCYLKLPVICELMDLHTSASMYPAISVQDILNLPFKHPGKKAEGEIVDLVQTARSKRKQSKSLLERAKRAVEVAIEQDESTALAYLDGKHYVADELLPKLFGPGRHYVDLASIQRTLEAEAIHYEPTTIKRYLQQWQNEERVYDAGRGWYSDIPAAWSADENIEPIAAVVKTMSSAFPLLDFTIWSTRELAAYFHHLPSRHATLLMVDRDAFEPVAQALRDANIRVVVHPLGEVAKAFLLEEPDTVILRPRLSTDQVHRRPPVEQTLVDLLFEIQKLALFDGGEISQVTGNLSSAYRLNITALRRYAERRKLDADDILGVIV